MIRVAQSTKGPRHTPTEPRLTPSLPAETLPVQYDESTVEFVRTALIITLKISAPVLAAGLLIGLFISIVQSITSIQDQTLANVPKIVVMIIVFVLLLPWITMRLVEYSAELFVLTP